MRRWIWVLALSGLAGCQGSELASTPRSIEFAGVMTAGLEGTTAQAQAHCEKYGRDAERALGDQKPGRVTFRCVDW